MELLKQAYSILKPSKCSVICKLPNINLTIKLEKTFLSNIQKHSQILPWSTEAGGQLFGVMKGDQLKIKCASGPYDKDERSRHHYRSSAVAAQEAINEKSSRGLLYLGEWHTHAENQPTASQVDRDAMLKLMQNSRLNSNFLILVILGREPGLSGLCVYTFQKEVCKWDLSKE